MEHLVSSLSDKSIDFIAKIHYAQCILNADGCIFPERIQFIWDWLLSSLLKIGKHDDSNLYHRIQVMHRC